ncbi:predicted protein [Verticillium alfalfae VaMs.102]|uniref:Predicted protein n=1 Tax=Verticillium alfalfae (strain VaMs.102 / ATCC MYA-4576 / FGSC 10136) TaxID=526221 RepID=C9S6D4_VERA1|nr:predicted protein [Verticillium alfalfae VaMs.102]EEY14446.1 predicted protein [Verticillium alfalfae VaMs.102]
MVLPTVSFVNLLAISLAGFVASQSDDFDCCFTLEVSGDLGGKVKHGTTGDLRVHSNFQEAFMCAYESADRLQDSIGNSCRFSSPSMKFECVSGVPGDGDFFFDFGEATDGGEKPILLTYDGHDKFLACPSEGPSSDAGSFVLYSRAKEDQEGCVDVSLQQVGPSSACYDRGHLEKFRSPTKSTRAPVTGTIEEVSPARKSCTLSDTSTRLPAKRVGSGPLDGLVVNPDGWASINDENSTVFEFEMAPLWVNHPPRRDHPPLRRRVSLSRLREPARGLPVCFLERVGAAGLGWRGHGVASCLHARRSCGFEPRDFCGACRLGAMG